MDPEWYAWKRLYHHELLYAGPLFIHQYSHVWTDFRGIRDAYMRERGTDYFENSRRATLVQREYAIQNPNEYLGYAACCWGFTASEGPGPDTRRIDGVQRRFWDYVARGAPFGPDDGSIAPWAAVASLPFAPEVVLPTLRHFTEVRVGEHPLGLEATFNPTYPDGKGPEPGWLSPWHYGINQGPIVTMIENYRTGLVWQRMRGCEPLVRGLRRAGFSGGWLG